MSTLPIVSGGLDSVTMLYDLIARGHQVGNVLSFRYGQRHEREIEAAADFARAVRANHVVLNLTSILGGAPSALTSNAIDVPDGHYAEKTMQATIVPGRNLLFIAAAIAEAGKRGDDTVAIGVHGGDHFIYPDCRPEFISPLQHAVFGGYGMALAAPFIEHDKTYIVRRAVELRVDVAHTWSCYKGGDVQCGRCGTCQERRAAFIEAGVDDPTPYAYNGPLTPAPEGVK